MHMRKKRDDSVTPMFHHGHLLCGPCDESHTCELMQFTVINEPHNTVNSQIHSIDVLQVRLLRQDLHQ